MSFFQSSCPGSGEWACRELVLSVVEGRSRMGVGEEELLIIEQCPMPNTSATLSTSAPCPMPNAQ
ncbi:hypothetical protein [Nostoc sp.]|uniref:hypothetical protein n=1 Tax=Nostoc sp. TaxID=1180 RepID=UPI002FF55006